MAAVLAVIIIIFLVLIFAYPRQTLLIMFIGALFVVGYINDAKEEAERLRQKKNEFVIQISIDKVRCKNLSDPLLIKMHNQSGDTVVYVDFGILAYRQHYSRPMLSSSYSTDRIIPNGQTWEVCTNAPSGDTKGIPLDNLNWAISYKHVEWR